MLPKQILQHVLNMGGRNKQHFSIIYQHESSYGNPIDCLRSA
jgi:hypothetical protein